jgi:hypothetical protein
MTPFSGVRRTALPVRVTRLLTAAVTAVGQCIVLCLNPATIVVSIHEIAAGNHTARAQTSLCPLRGTKLLNSTIGR